MKMWTLSEREEKREKENLVYTIVYNNDLFFTTFCLQKQNIKYISAINNILFFRYFQLNNLSNVSIEKSNRLNKEKPIH